MFGIFKRRKTKQPVMHTVWQRWALAIDKRQRKCASYLNHKAEKYSKRCKQICLALFCLFAGGSSTYIAIRAIENPSGKLRIEKISVPKYAMERDSISAFQSMPVLTEKQYHNIQQFKKYMVSLELTKAGKIKHDSIMKTRPGLMDSIAFIEQVYRQQIKTK